MAFNTDFQAAFYTDLPNEEWVITTDDDADISPDSWDSKKVVLTGIWPDIVSPSDFGALPPDADTTRGWIGYQPIAGQTFWAQRVRFKCLNGAIWQAELDCLGFANNKLAKCRVGVGTEQQQATNVDVPGFGFASRVRALVPTIEYERVYLFAGTLDLTEIGTMLAPPDAPTSLPDNPWSSIADPEIRYPYNWCLMSRQPEYLVGVPRVSAALVRDVFSYVFQAAP